MDKRKLSDVASWVLVLCALLTTGLVVRREFVADASLDAQKGEQKGEAIYVEGWKDALAVNAG